MYITRKAATQNGRYVLLKKIKRPRRTQSKNVSCLDERKIYLRAVLQCEHAIKHWCSITIWKLINASCQPQQILLILSCFGQYWQCSDIKCMVFKTQNKLCINRMPIYRIFVYRIYIKNIYIYVHIENII